MIPEKIDMISKILAFFLPNIFGKPKELFKVSVLGAYLCDQFEQYLKEAGITFYNKEYETINFGSEQIGIIYFLDYNQLTMVLLKYQCAFSELSGYYSPIFEEQEYEPSDFFKEKYT